MDFDDIQLQEIHEYINAIYSNKEHCYIKLFNKNNNHYKFYDINSIKDINKLKTILHTFNIKDLFISANTFKTKEKATASNIFAINTIAVDIDYKKKTQFKELKPEQVIKLLELDYFGRTIAEPTFIEYGNQIRLIYVLSDTVYVPKGKPASKVLCDRISEVFARELIDFGAEVQKSEKFLRIPYSINNKTKDIVYIKKYSDYKYSLSELQELWLDELPEWYDRWSLKKERKLKSKFNINNFNKQRLSDFEKIQDYLNNINHMDFRKRLCFLYHNYSLLVLKKDKRIKNPEAKALKMMLEYNSKFKKPLKENNIVGDTKFLRGKQYIYSNKKLLSFLELDPVICSEINLESIFKVKSKKDYNKTYYIDNKEYLLNNKKEYYKENKKEISKKAKNKYQKKLKESGKLSRAEENDILRKKIKDLLLEGLKQDYIAFKLDIGVSTVKRHIAYMKKEGLLE